MEDEWWNGDVDPDPNVQTAWQYYRLLSVSTQVAGTAVDIATFDAMSIIDVLTTTSSPNYMPLISEELRIMSINLTTFESTTRSSVWSGTATFDSHVPGSPTPVPEPASIGARRQRPGGGGDSWTRPSVLTLRAWDEPHSENDPLRDRLKATT